MSGPSNFYYTVSGQQAEQLLLSAAGRDGSFLARPSTKKGGFTLSVRRQDRVTHIRIQCTGDGLDLNGGETFATLGELVQYYMENTDLLKEVDGDVIPLRYPLSLTASAADIACISGCSSAQQLTSERWFHAGITSKEAERLLLEQGRVGSYLVRESQTTPGQYAISARVAPQQVTHVRVYETEKGFDVMGDGAGFATLAELLAHHCNMPMIGADGCVVHLKQPLTSMRIKAIHVPDRLAEMLKEGSNDTDASNTASTAAKGRLADEFDSLEHFDSKQHLYSRKEGRRADNQKKNRYKNIVPFDHTRIVLNADDLTPEQRQDVGHDYINANKIEILPDYPEFSCLGHRSYISTQGCLSNTIDDFWRMVWQTNSRIIVMTTREVERARTKCARYWPEPGSTQPTVYAGYLHVQNKGEQPGDDYIVRTLTISNARRPNEPMRTIYHYQYTGWPDHGCPVDPGVVLNFVDQWNERARQSPSDAVIVHCRCARVHALVSTHSAGIGRTGTIIAIDLIVNQLRRVGLHAPVDVAHCVQMLREQRSGMVQTEQQYTFIYQALAHYVDVQAQMLDNVCRTRVGHEYTNINVHDGTVIVGDVAATDNKSTSDENTFQLQAPPLPRRAQAKNM